MASIRVNIQTRRFSLLQKGSIFSYYNKSKKQIVKDIKYDKNNRRIFVIENLIGDVKEVHEKHSNTHIRVYVHSATLLIKRNDVFSHSST